MTKGVISLLIGSAGHVVAHAADFHPDRPGGMSQQEAQRHRSRQQLYRSAIREMCNWDIPEAIDTYQCEKIVHALCDKKGYRIEHVPVGYDEPNVDQ